MKKLCVYHGNCADGFAAALAVRSAIGKENIDFHAGVYQDEPPDVTEREIIIVDFSYKRPVLIEMAEEAKSILILDHHASAEKDLVDLPANVTAIFDMRRSGAMMAWDYFLPAAPRPKLIDHIQDRDLWRFELEGTREIQAALFSYEYDFDLWESLMLENTRVLRDEGRAIERKHFKDIHEFIASAGYRDVIAGYDVPVLNAPYFWSSDAGHIMAQGEPFAACYWDTAKGRVYSLRSSTDGLDVSKIAAQFGGGGHKHAAGYRV
ncbi:MAG: phosphohydrolase [Gammaproteobacteria bacterium]|nr:phosphohydrolase [Gammaproteobacteria bacterium]